MATGLQQTNKVKFGKRCVGLEHVGEGLDPMVANKIVYQSRKCQ